jgi:hypothetical protein
LAIASRLVPYLMAISPAIIKSAEAVGIPFNADYSGATQDGVAMAQCNGRQLPSPKTTKIRWTLLQKGGDSFHVFLVAVN